MLQAKNGIQHIAVGSDNNERKKKMPAIQPDSQQASNGKIATAA